MTILFGELLYVKLPAPSKDFSIETHQLEVHDYVGQLGVKEIHVYPRRCWCEVIAGSVNAEYYVEVNQPSTLILSDL